MKEIKRPLSSAMEDYLEAIASLQRQRSVCRVRDISGLLNVKSPSVNAALKTLSRRGLLIHEKYGYVNLTSKGEEIAASIQGKHDILLKFLTEILGIKPDEAMQEACSMEHSISPKTFERLTKFIAFAGSSLNGKSPQWLKGFRYYIKTGRKPLCPMRAGSKG
ncbi:MAG: metal-dependent transcriptional regulator [Candidatus Omnitrophica bacterium]|jgi:DtxR family Mn-dependent transcriptional regulator|nr:metal-dependent transcriptional regulator [Candidatus Omnitrophota bacterium]